MIKVIQSESAHWYKPDGSPFYQIEMKTKPGQFRAPTVADARKLNLLPSVTTIMRVLHKPNLQNWLYGRYILAARTTPMTEGMTEDQWVKAVIEAANEASKDAADLGSRVHDAIQWYITTDEPDPKELGELAQYVEPVQVWIARNVDKWIALEEPFGNAALGYGGKIDAIAILKDGRLAFIDWKTSGSERLTAWPEHGMQLAAYYGGYPMAKLTALPVWPHRKKVALLNVVISTKRPGDLHIHEWENSAELFKAFKHCRDLWQWQKNYKPEAPK